MDKIIGSVEYTDENGNKNEENLFNYDEEERQRNEINRENAKLAIKTKYLVIPIEVFKLGLSGNEAILFAFIDSWLSGEKQRFYFTNKQLADLFNISGKTISLLLTKLSKRGLISLGYKRRANGGQIRFVNIPTSKNVKSPTYKKVKLQLNKRLSSNLTKGYGSNNNISNNNISNNITITGKPVKKYGNQEINSIIDLLKEKLGIPSLAGTDKENRNYAWLLIKRLKKDFPEKTPLEIIMALLMVYQGNPYMPRIAGTKSLFYKYPEIIVAYKKEHEKKPLILKL